MRFLLIAGGSGGNKVKAQYQISVKVRGGSRGIIGSGVSAICPATMITTSGGTLLMATGYGPMLRMRQNENRLTPAGVPAPGQPIIIASGLDLGYQTTTVTLYFDYTRFGPFAYQGGVNVASRQQRTSDRMRVARLIPDDGSTVTTFELNGQPVTSTGDLSAQQQLSDIFNGIVKDLVTTSTPGSGGIMFFPQNSYNARWKNMVFSLTINNRAAPNTSATQNYTGRYQAFMRYVDKDYNVSDPSPISLDYVVDGEPAIAYTNLEVPTDQRIIRRQIFRNEDGESDRFYLDIDTDDLTSTALMSLNSDEQLKLNYGLSVFDDNGENQLYLYGLPPQDKPYIAEFGSIVFACGIRLYSEGNVTVDNGSTYVYGIGTKWPSTFADRQIVIGNRVYTIVLVDVGLQRITIDSGYAGPTTPYSEYVIQPFYANGNQFNWTEPGFPEAWPILNSLTLPEDDDDITGMKVFANSLWILKANSIYQFNMTTNPGRDGDYKPATNRGCVNQRCAVDIQNVCLMLDRIGIHVFKGNMPRYNYQADTTPDHLSKAIGDIFRFEGTWLRLNWDADKCFWHAIHNKEITTVRWYVTMMGYDYPQHAICYDYLMDRWWLEEYPFPITSSTLSASLNGIPILGGYGGKVFMPDRGPLDIINTGETRLDVSASYGGITITTETTPPTCVGMSIAIVKGQGHGQMRLVLEQSGNDITVDYPFFPEPDDSSVLQIGAINYYMATPEYSYAKVEVENPQAFVAEYRHTDNPLECYASVLVDRIEMRQIGVDASWGSVTSLKNDPFDYMFDLNSELGYARISMEGRRDKNQPQKYTVQMFVAGFSGQERPQFTGMQIIGAALKKDMGL